MKIAPLLLSASLAVSAWAAPQGQAGKEFPGKVLYRYTDERGVRVMGETVPPNHVAGGYEIVSLTGRLLKVVPPQKSGEELEKEQRLRQQQQADQELLNRYNSLADIESARSRKLAIVEQDMAIMRSNIANLGHQIKQEESSAARIQRNGGKVSAEALARIDSLREEVSVLRERLSQREVEAEKLNREFDQAAARYAEIAGK